MDILRNFINLREEIQQSIERKAKELKEISSRRLLDKSLVSLDISVNLLKYMNNKDNQIKVICSSDKYFLITKSVINNCLFDNILKEEILNVNENQKEVFIDIEYKYLKHIIDIIRYFQSEYIKDIESTTDQYNIYYEADIDIVVFQRILNDFFLGNAEVKSKFNLYPLKEKEKIERKIFFKDGKMTNITKKEYEEIKQNERFSLY